MGDDTIPPPHGFVQLLQKMQRHPDKKIVTGVYFSRSFPPQPMLWRGWMDGSYYDWHVGEFFEVDWAGCDCLMIDVDVFRNMPKPWFSQDYVFGPNQKTPPALATEDIYFYEKARKYGYAAWCDASVQCVHQDRDTGQSFFLPPDWPQRYEGTVIEPQRPEYLVADLGAGTESPYTTGTLVRIDLDESIQPDIRADLRSIPIDDMHFDEVWSRHTLEHFGRDEAPGLIQEWCRILKIGGRLQINVPNVEEAFRTILANIDQPGSADTEYAWWQIYGQQAAPLDFHKNGFTQRLLGKLLEYAWGDQPIHAVDGEGNIVDEVGCLTDIKVEVTGMESHRSSLNATATKVRHPKAAILGPLGRHASIGALESETVLSTPMSEATAVAVAEVLEPVSIEVSTGGRIKSYPVDVHDVPVVPEPEAIKQ
jgi:SAM-dependent methyltransferase